MVLFFPPIWHDLALGTSACSRWRCWPSCSPVATAWGVAFGLLLLLAPKPHLLPLALWLAVRRPRDAVAALAVLGIGRGRGRGVRPELWLAWLETFREPLERTFTANIGFSGLLGPPGVVVGVIAAVVIGAAALVRRGDIGLGLSLVSGIVLGPYALSTTCRGWWWSSIRSSAAVRAGWRPTRGC